MSDAKVLVRKKPRSRIREGPGDEREKRGKAVLSLLRREFRGAGTALRHENPFQLLVATILSAQCTDERVNMVTPALFAKYHDPEAFAKANQHEMEEEIRSTGFFRMKSKNIIGCSRAIVEHHGGTVPSTIEELTKLAGVGRKTANVVLGQAFGISSGVVVDTHVFRVSRRLGFSREETAEGVERDLMKVFAKREWIFVGTSLILHGRKTCLARKPRCSVCSLQDLCPSAGFWS